MLHILKTRSELRQFLEQQHADKRSVGLVPTMGALHAGHLSLIARSTAENDLTLCSIFVNPTQFNDPADLERYPRPLEEDLDQLRASGCQALFLPSVAEMYPEKERWQLDLGQLEQLLEGAFRPGHYQGVTQVVNKLFDLVAPHRAYFGQKDYQQFLVIRRMVELLKHQVKLVCCPTRREADGLAMSSRNVHLSAEERKEARLLSQALFSIRAAAPGNDDAEAVFSGKSERSAGDDQGTRDERRRISLQTARKKALELLQRSPLIKIDYLELADGKTLQPVSDWDAAPSVIALAAIWIGQTRLIDNVFIKQDC